MIIHLNKLLQMKTEKDRIAPIDCDEAARRMNSYIDNYLKGIEREELVSHIANCRHCFERVEFEQMLKSKISSLGRIDAENEKTARRDFENILSKIYTK